MKEDTSKTNEQTKPTPKKSAPTNEANADNKKQASAAANEWCHTRSAPPPQTNHATDTTTSVQQVGEPLRFAGKKEEQTLCVRIKRENILQYK